MYSTVTLFVLHLTLWHNQFVNNYYANPSIRFKGRFLFLQKLIINFDVICSDPTLLDECGLDDNTKETLLGIIRRKLTQQAVKIRSDIEVACYGYEGIGAVKKALKAGIACSTEEIPIKINLIAPPLYVMTTQTPERPDGLKALEIAIEKVQEVIVGLGGVFNIQMAVSYLY